MPDCIACLGVEAAGHPDHNSSAYWPARVYISVVSAISLRLPQGGTRESSDPFGQNRSRVLIRITADLHHN